MTYQKLQDQAKYLHTQADILEAQAEEAKQQDIKKLGLRGWLGYHFESSSSLTPEFSQFSKDIKKELSKLMVGYEMLSYSRGHFEVSMFFKNIETNKLVYISCSDIRFWPDEWFNNLLIRTATHNKDYTGGSNNYTSLPLLKDKADILTQ